MARRLKALLLILCLPIMGESSSAQPPVPPGSQPPPPRTEAPGDPPRPKPPREGERDGDHHDRRDGKVDNSKAGDGNRGEGRGGDGRGGDGRGGDNRFRSARFFMDAVRRDGGPLELMPILLSKPARTEAGLDETFDTKLDAYLAEVQKRWEQERKSAETDPKYRPMPLSERVTKASESFNKLLAELTPEQRDRVIGLFVQWRNYRALSNRLVTIDKMKLTSERAAELRKEIDKIRDDVMDESRDRFRQIWENARDRSETDQLMRKNREKIDNRIRALLSETEIKLLNELRGKPAPRELLESLDAPPPPPRPR